MQVKEFTSIYLSLANYLKSQHKMPHSNVEARAKITKGKTSQMKLGRTSASLDEIHSVLIAFPEATQHYLSEIEKAGLNKSGYEFVLLSERLHKAGNPRTDIAQNIDLPLKEFLILLSNPDQINTNHVKRLVSAYPEIDLLPSYNPDESPESLSIRIKMLEQQIQEMRNQSKDEQIIEMIRQLQKDIQSLKR